MNHWNAIFRTGRHTDSSGISREFTTADLDAMVAGYDPAYHEAPLVIGHPKTDAPAFGWVEGLKRVGDRLMAKFKEVPDEVKALVRDRRFKKVSIALYPNMTLRHVGLLGATPPAVKGLGSISFESGEEWRAYEFSDNQAEEMDMDELERLKKEKAAAEARAAEAERARDKAEAEKAEAEQAAKQAQDEKAQKEAEFAEARAARQAKDRQARFEALTQAGKALPGEMETVLGLAGTLAGAGEITFSEGDREVKQGAEEALWKFLESRPAHGLLGEFAEDPGRSEVGDQTAGNFAAKF